MRLFDPFPYNPDGPYGAFFGPDTPEFGVVISAPLPKTRGQAQLGPLGPKSLQALQDWTEGELGSFYAAYLVKEAVAWKAKVPIKLIREAIPAFNREMLLALYGVYQSYADIQAGVCRCVICSELNSLENETCHVCGAELSEDMKQGPPEQPKRVLVCGKDAASVLCPGFKNLNEDHGSFFYNADIHAYCIPTFEFWQTVFDPSKNDLIRNDIQRMRVLSDPSTPKFEFVKDFSPVDKSLPIVLDIETTGLSSWDDRITSIGFKNLNVGEKVFIIENPTQFLIDNFIEEVEATEGNELICHNTQFDTHFMYHQVNRKEVKMTLRDTMIMAFIRGEEPLNLKHLTSKYLSRPGSRSLGGIEDPEYLAEDVLSTEELYNLFSDTESWAMELLHAILPQIIEMRLQGVYIDPFKFEEIVPEFEANVAQAKALLDEASTALQLGELNFNSTQQVADFLLASGVKLREKTKTGRYAVSEPILQELKGTNTAVDQLLDYRFHTKQATFLTSYRDFLKYDGYLHPRLKLTGALTGRLSCSDPNLQQVPRVGPVKLLFTSRFQYGYYGLIDLSQAELRVLALLANDEVFADALLAEDVHRKIASMVFRKDEEAVSSGERKASKAITFGLIYGGTDQGLAGRAGIPVNQVAHVRTTFLSTFQGVNNYLNDNAEKAIQQGFVTSPLGRTRDISTVLAREGYNGAVRKSNNTPIQGTASDIMLFINYQSGKQVRELNMWSRPIFGVHDSTLLDIHPTELLPVAHVVQKAFWMLNATPLIEFPLWEKLPIVGELVIANNWAGTESTSEYYDPKYTIDCSSHLNPTLEVTQQMLTKVEKEGVDWAALSQPEDLFDYEDEEVMEDWG